MTLEELGRSIKEKREAAGISLDDVAARIKISARILRTIEEGSLVGLPHAVYTKSFIRSFGQLVGYDSQELNAALEELFPPDAFDESKAESVLLANPAMSYPDAGKRFAIMLLMLVLTAGLIGGGWYVAAKYGGQIVEAIKAPFSALTSPSEETREQPAPPAGSPPENSSSLSNTLSVLAAHSSPANDQAISPRVASPPGTLSATPAPGATNDSPASAGVDASSSGNGVEDSAPQMNNDVALSQLSTPVPEAEERTSARATNDDLVAVNEEASTPGGKNRLVVRAHAECWISSRADGGRAREYMLRPGMDFAIAYNDRLEITFGNAGGVRVSHNGKELGIPGADRQVVVMRFP
jgi:cytoskeleton protein RodZ